MVTRMTSSPSSAPEFAAAIYAQRLIAADPASSPAERAKAERKSYRLDDQAAAAGYGSKQGVDFGHLDEEATAHHYPESRVAQIVAARKAAQVA